MSGGRVDGEGAAIRTYMVPLVTVFLGVLHSVLASHVSMLGVCPNLVLLLTISSSLLMGTRVGVLAALSGGIVLDALSGASFGISTTALVVVALIAGLGEAYLFRSVKALPYVGAALGTLIYCTIELALLNIGGEGIPWVPMMWYIVTPLAVANTVSMVAVHYLVVRICRRAGRRQMEWA